MCGLIGITDSSCRREMESALSLIAHRGPDGSGVFADDAVTLGHTRLAIIDPDHGAQPFETDDNRFVLVFNGEIYNFQDLNRELRSRGIAIRSRCDTETLALWLREFGTSRLADLNGMFAFAFWDRVEKKLLLARDRFGIKPLYTSERNGKLIFGSEIKALLPWLPPVKPNYRAISEFLTFQNILSPVTFFEGVDKFSPGSWLEWQPDGIRKGRFWNLEFTYDSDSSFPDAAQEFRSKLEHSMDHHMISDVPLGSYLSGGIDSGSVASLAAQRTDTPIDTFTGAFDDAPYYDERDGARSVADAIGAKYRDVMITPDHYTDMLPSVMWHLDEPTLGTGALPQFIVSRLASQHVKVVLTGHGGDELFAGYQVNKAFQIRSALSQGLSALMRAIGSVRKDEITRVLYFLLYPLIQPEVRHGIFIMTPKKQWNSFCSPDLLNELDGFQPLDSIGSVVGAGGKFSAQETLFALYLRTYLQTLLIQEDKMGMAHSIEARMPLCENNLLDMATRLPLETKLTNGQLKAIPKEAMRDVLPKKLYTLPKRGFPTPFARWYREGNVSEMMRDLVTSQSANGRGIANPDVTAALFGKHYTSKGETLADYARANKIYSLGMIELWFRTFVDGDPLKGRMGDGKS